MLDQRGCLGAILLAAAVGMPMLAQVQTPAQHAVDGVDYTSSGNSVTAAGRSGVTYFNQAMDAFKRKAVALHSAAL